MTRAQALDFSLALAGQKVSHEIAFAYDAAGAESANVQLAAGIVYTGPQLGLLATYCANHALTLQLIPGSMVVS